MSNPLVDRILNSPLTFVSGKHAEDLQTVKGAGYIVLSSAPAPKKAPKKMRAQPPRPKTLAEAVAAYTGKKIEKRGDRKRQAKEEDGVERADADSDPLSDDARYESASEFQTDLSFHGFRSLEDLADSEDLGEDVGEDVGENVPDSTLPVLHGTELALPETDDESVSLGSESESESESEGEGESESEGEASAVREPEVPTAEDKIQLKQDLLDDRKTPPAPEVAETVDVLNVHPLYAEGDPEFRWLPAYRTKKPAGLLNFGVTCYMNLAIQSMVHIPAVQAYLQKVAKNNELPRSVTHTFAELATKMWDSNKKYINPKKLVHRLDDINCMMSEWQQEDSHEYFMSLMGRMQEDSTPKGAKLNLSILYDIFGGLLHQEVVCQKCKTSSVTKQEFYDLSLGFTRKKLENEDTEKSEDEKDEGYSIDRAMGDFFSTETIRVDKVDQLGYWCEKCQKNTVATKKSLVDKAPETLMVHLKRFKFNGNSSLKVKQPILYKKYLDLGPYTTNTENSQSQKYQLVSVIVHEGRSILSGHYIAHCYQPDNSWSTYDDEYINAIDERGALSDPSAYCLVYMKLHSKKRASDAKSPSPKKQKR